MQNLFSLSLPLSLLIYHLSIFKHLYTSLVVWIYDSYSASFFDCSSVFLPVHLVSFPCFSYHLLSLHFSINIFTLSAETQHAIETSFSRYREPDRALKRELEISCRLHFLFLPDVSCRNSRGVATAAELQTKQHRRREI